MPKASALEYAYSLDLGYGKSNNLSQRRDGEEGRYVDYGLGIEIGNSLQKEWELDISGSISKVDYSETDLSSETNTELEGIAVYSSSTNNFSLVTLANISQAPINRFQTQEVNNNRDEVVYAAMPSYYFSINSADRINAFYTLVDINLEDIEGLQTGGQARSSLDQEFLVNYAKQINSTNTLALNFSSGKTDFDDGLELGAVDYEREDVFLSWSVAGQTDQLQLEVGRSNIEDQLGRKQDLEHQLFEYTRQLNRNNILSLAYSDGFNNPLSNNQATNTIQVNQQNNNITAAQETKQYSLDYRINGDLLSTVFGITDGEVRQSFTQNIENRKGISLNINYQLSRILDSSGRSNIALNYLNTKSEFNGELTTVLSNEIESYGITYNYVHSRNLVFALSYSVREALQITTNNDQNIVDSKATFFTVIYSDRDRF